MPRSCTSLRHTIHLLLVTLLIASCASLPEGYDKPESSAIEDHLKTPAGRHIAKLVEENGGQSGFGLLRYGIDAFNMRIAMIERATRSIDVQVYIWEVDETGWIFAERLIEAADRGVRVRMLIDDHGLQAGDRSIAAMDTHPNIEVRLFNPAANRGAKSLDFLTDLDRVNNRMHNKTFIVDNSIAVVGGRNIGNHYFGVNQDTNFRDLDIGAIGPVVRDISAVFDHFWRGEWAVPISALFDEELPPDYLRQTYANLRQSIEHGNYPYDVDADIEVVEIIPERLLLWGEGHIIWDDPAQQELLEDTHGASRIARNMRKKLDSLQRSVEIESAYFIVGETGVETAKRMVDRGVTVRVLTNSLASNDVIAAHAGHAKYREDLLRAGVDLYELRADSEIIKKTWQGNSRAGLHTKALVFDREAVFIGSYNLDPRSANINTEAGLYVQSEELAAQLLAYMDSGIQPEHAYRLELAEDGDLVWIGFEDGQGVRYDTDPQSTWSQRFMSGFIGLLPIESQL